MPAPVLAAVAKDFAIDAALRAGRAMWKQFPWAKDQARVQAVEARIRRLAADVSDLSRNLADDSMDASLSRIFAQFERDLVALGLSAIEAQELTEIQREQLHATVIEAVRERRQMAKWLQHMEQRLAATEKQSEQFERVKELEAQVSTLKMMVSAALALAIVATLLSVLFFTK
jgi:hypothetical protein